MGAGCPSSYTPCLMRIPIIVAVTLLPIDQLSSGVCEVIPCAYRSPTKRPFQVTTNAAVISAGISNAASTACFTLFMSSCDGYGSFGSTSPIGHGCFDGRVASVSLAPA